VCSLIGKSVGVNGQSVRLLRLCSWDDIWQAAEVLTPISTGKRALKIQASTMRALEHGAREIELGMPACLRSARSE
jgi:hypothetical protein